MSINGCAHEFQEIEKLRSLFNIENPELIKELELLAIAQEGVMALVCSRRALEVIIIEICENKLKRERGTEPLKSIIDRLFKEKSMPDYVLTAMQNLNNIATYGAHPKEFDPNQVRTALLELSTILKWYFKEKNYQTGTKKNNTLNPQVKNMQISKRFYDHLLLKLKFWIIKMKLLNGVDL